MAICNTNTFKYKSNTICTHTRKHKTLATKKNHKLFVRMNIYERSFWFKK